ncbi:hypothetical protein ACHAWT_003224 [Skeletonema menzelii]|mmetsp:Transcript_17570/g.28762  ORF Transcript_17570/g.28762 Transcript_17570/m.28762 type:complete len:97 (+) Transcript_17570:63-353(+)
MAFSHSSSSSMSLTAFVGSFLLPLFLAFAACLTMVLVTHNKRRMKRRGRWQPTKRFLPVLLCNWIFGLFLSNRGADRGADVHSNKSLTSYNRQHST